MLKSFFKKQHCRKKMHIKCLVHSHLFCDKTKKEVMPSICHSSKLVFLKTNFKKAWWAILIAYILNKQVDLLLPPFSLKRGKQQLKKNGQNRYKNRAAAAGSTWRERQPIIITRTTTASLCPIYHGSRRRERRVLTCNQKKACHIYQNAPLIITRALIVIKMKDTTE